MRLQMNWPYVAAVLVVAGTASGFMGWLITAPAVLAWQRGEPLPGGWTWTAVVLFDGAFAATFFALLWKAYADSRTTLTSEELRRPGVLGTRTLRWNSVQSVRLVHYGVHLLGSEGRIVVTPYAYGNPRAVIRFILDRTRHAATDRSNA
jgi:hypothetical protein